MNDKDSLGNRIKKYEDAYRHVLPIRLPIIMRFDGRTFHSYTKDCKKPVDQGLVDCMNETAKYLCENIQGCQIGYIQSDEISLLINNYKTLDTQPWFENNIQKMVSISAAMASVIFTKNSYKIWGEHLYAEGQENETREPIIKPAFFDARIFVLPKEEVNNALLWRQQDCTRNSVQMLARSLFSHKQCNNKNNSELQQMIFEKGINWNDCPTFQKRGRCIIKQKVIKTGFNFKTLESSFVERSEWTIDNEIPIFSQDKNYIEQYL